MGKSGNDNTDYHLRCLLSNKRLKDLFYQKRVLEDYILKDDLTLMMIRKYGDKAFYQHARAKGVQELAEEYIRTEKNLSDLKAELQLVSDKISRHLDAADYIKKYNVLKHLKDQICEGQNSFAFYDTVSDTILDFDGEQVFDERKEFEEAFSKSYMDKEGGTRPLSRFVSLIPENYFESGQ